MRRITRVTAVVATALAMFASLLVTPVTAHAQNNNKTAYDYLVGRGLTKEQSAGVVGNLIQESGNPINPRAVQYGGPGRGIAQWSVGERWATLQNYAAQQGRDPWALDLQLDFLWHELNTTESYAFRHLKAASTVRDATIAFSSKFERCGVCHNEKRVAYAQSIYDSFAGGGAPAPQPGPGTQLAQGTTTDYLTLRGDTNTQSSRISELPPNTTVGVQCQARGEMIHGTYSTNWWAKVTYNGRTGYVSRAYLRIPTGQPGVPECGTTPPAPPAPQPGPGSQLAQGTTTDYLTLRSGTNTWAQALAELPPNTTVGVQCQARGELIRGTYTSNWWAKVTYNGREGYVSRAYLRIPTG
ncbi:phage tail tip lysozyme, partial [Tessaracoccus sp. OH4464_COT-324]|uniref:phage tail tip lysozyme n=1 Tax=Tessaracoccus sp. OH4464_COT-324 TaxID=2491059 RepID=UPI001319D8D7